MKKNYLYVAVALISAICTSQTSQEFAKITSKYDKEKTNAVIEYLGLEYQKQERRVKAYLESLSSEERAKINESTLVDITPEGELLHIVPTNNHAAITMKVDRLYQGGSLGLDLAGQNMVAGVWEAQNGYALPFHLDLVGRLTVIDGGGPSTFHATHVTGTIISSGENFIGNLGRGIAYEASALVANSANDSQEMATQAAEGLLVSNHSYGLSAENLSVSAFGAYINSSFNLDLITSNNPYYLPVVSAGNDRDDYVLYNPSQGGYDLLTGFSTSKNSITSAAVQEVLNYSRPGDVIMSTFSNWGPTDDGRIKPDISSQGVDVRSTVETSNTAYGLSSGTSMSAPTITGLLLLLQQHYNDVNSEFMLAATAKGLLLHTADEAGSSPGPDYRFGWGLANGEKAVETITNNGVNSHIEESSINNTETKTFNILATGDEPLKVSISWTEPVGTVINNDENNRTAQLVNDLDVKLTMDGTDYFPWKLSPISPSTGATRNSTNDVDNFEKIKVDNPISNDVYTATITHKGTLSGGSQNYSLVITGGILTDLSVEEQDALKTDIVIYPNPANDIVTIKSRTTSQFKNYKIIDNIGRVALEGNFESNSNTPQINVSQISKGIYHLMVFSETGVFTQKLIKM